ncbi:chemotaxis protein CheX [Stieleria sp. JC731]|uniref:chemotaxis protein CheX n=1 Tax=Pirellulaceae TaxID=2691357 RepID=UPI001E556FF6|nr:chemotaxis protein CheX [Stieleria sp. JC731]MCC9604007.1 chemotaxis protein CheX [Stieleria sp. JC731]
MRSASQIIDEEFTNAVVELFEFYSDSAVKPQFLDRVASAELLRKEADNYARSNEMVTSSIGLCGDQVRCSIGLLSNVDTINALCQGLADSPTDWVGELTNQLAGRFKNNLAAFHVDCQMGLPVSVQGLQLGFTTGCSEQTILAVQMSLGTVIVLLHVNITDDSSWEHHPDLVCADEGSLHLF